MTSLCPSDSGGGREAFRRLCLNANRDRIPLKGSFDLTSRCNLRCVHCYLPGDGPSGAEDEASGALWKSIFEQAADAGCLFALLTGGEPMLRDDFVALYARAAEKGMLVTVFTNGTLVDREIVRAFLDLPPHGVEISLYGACAATHDAVTGTPGSWELSLRGIRLLREAEIPLKLKTVLLTVNFRELEGMEKLAADLGLKFRLDVTVIPRLDGDLTPLRYQLPPEQAVGIEMSAPDRAAAWARYAATAGRAPLSAGAFDCGAGLNCFHIDSRGVLYPCLLARTPGCDLGRGTFADGWRDAIGAIRNQPRAPGDPCPGCEFRATCGYCPGSFSLDSGGEGRYRGNVCEIARRRFESLRLAGSGGESRNG